MGIYCVVSLMTRATYATPQLLDRGQLIVLRMSVTVISAEGVY